MRLAADDAKKLGLVLRQRREAVGLSRAAVSATIHRDPSTLQAYEQGGKKVGGHWIVSSPSSAMLAEIAGLLGTTADSLLATAGLADESVVAATAGKVMATAAAGVRAVNVAGSAEDVAALLGLALERGLLGRLQFSPVVG